MSGPSREFIDWVHRLNNPPQLQSRRLRCETCGRLIENAVFGCNGTGCVLVEPEGTAV